MASSTGQRHAWDFQKTLTQIKDLPEGKHYVVLQEASITYDDGYGDGSRSTRHYIEYTYLVDRQAVQEWILKNTSSILYKIAIVEPIDVKIVTTVEIPDRDL